jgi:hypothetical protein
MAHYKCLAQTLEQAFASHQDLISQTLEPGLALACVLNSALLEPDSAIRRFPIPEHWAWADQAIGADLPA